MPSVRKNNRAATLLAELRDDDGLSMERLALLTGVTADDLRACRNQRLALPVSAQVRIAQAIGTRVPRLASRARRLEEQATAAARVSERRQRRAPHGTRPLVVKTRTRLAARPR